MQSFIVLISLTRMVQPWVARVVSFGDPAAYCWALAAPPSPCAILVAQAWY